MADYCEVSVFDRSHHLLGKIEYLASAQRSFALNGIGQARIVTTAKSPLFAAGIIEVGNIVLITSNAGVSPWGGWIISIDQTKTSLTINCKEIAYVFARRRLGKSEFFPYATPADLAKQLTVQTSPFVISSGGNSDTTTPFSKEFHFTGGLAALKRLPLDTGVDWWIQILPNGQGVLHTGNRGIDKSDSVVFSEGTNIADSIQYTRNGEAMINDVIFVGRGDGAWESAPHKQVAHPGSQAQYGLYAATNVRYDVVHAATLEIIARRYLERNSRPQELLSLSVINNAGIWSQFQEGDIVTCILPNYGPNGLNLPARVSAREIDEYSKDPMKVILEIV